MGQTATTAKVIHKVCNEGRCKLKQVLATNFKGSATYLHIFDAAALPSNSAVPTLPPIKMESGASLSLHFDWDCVTGLVIVASSTHEALTAEVSEVLAVAAVME